MTPTPAQSDETRQKVTATIKHPLSTDADIDYIMALIAAERIRLLDAVEGVIGPPETQEYTPDQTKGDDGLELIDRLRYIAIRNAFRAELRAALKGLREDDAYVRKVRWESGQLATPVDAQAQGHEADNLSAGGAPKRCEPDAFDGYCQEHHIPVEKCWEKRT